MIVRHNIPAINLNNNLSLNRSGQAKSLEKLSSGFRINRAGDDAAGLSISEKMRTQIRGLSMAQRNVQDGISLIQTAEGGLNEVHACLQRMDELLTQASNGTYQDSDRGNIQDEIDSLKNEIDHISESTKFNDITLLNGASSGTSISSTEKDKFISWLNGSWLKDAMTKVSDATGWEFPDNTEIDVVFKDQSGSSAVATMSGYYGGKDLTLTVNTKYLTDGMKYNGTDGPDCGGIPADRLITHEMTHGLMFDNIAADADPPFWFVEGLAESVHGASNIRFNDGSISNAEVLKIAQDITTYSFPQKQDKDIRAYTSGYLATSYVYKQMGDKDFKDALKDLKANQGKLQTMANDFKTEVGKIKTDATALKTFFENECGVDLTDGLADALMGDASSSAVVPNNPGTPTAPTGAQSKITFKSKDVLVNWDSKKTGGGDGGITLQIGDTADQTMSLSIEDVSSSALGLDSVSASTQSEAQSSIEVCKDAINAVSAARSSLGAFQNRLEHTMNNLQVTEENIVNSESRIRDTDMAKQMMDMVKQNVLVQAGEAMFSQVSQNPSKVLQLLQ